VRVSDQPKRLTGNAEAAFHLRANWNEFHVPSQGIRKEMVPFMTTVKPYLLPQQACADPQPDFFERGNSTGDPIRGGFAERPPQNPGTRID